MEYRTLGHSDLRVSVVGLGCNNFGGPTDLDGARKVVYRALDLGINLFDTADAYAPGAPGTSETMLGEILGPRRKDVVLATKFGHNVDARGQKDGASRRAVMQCVENSLHRLKTDTIDLYQQHTMDPLTPIDETLRALDDLVRQGKVRQIGCCNFTPDLLAEAHATTTASKLTPFVSCQDDLSLIVRHNQDALLPTVRAQKLSFLPYYPLASGLLTGKYRKGQPAPAGSRLDQVERWRTRYLTEKNLDTVEVLTAFAEKRGHTLLELAFSWLAAIDPVASVIAGATRPEQIDQNVQAVTWKLTSEDMAEIGRIRP